MKGIDICIRKWIESNPAYQTFNKNICFRLVFWLTPRDLWWVERAVTVSPPSVCLWQNHILCYIRSLLCAARLSSLTTSSTKPSALTHSTQQHVALIRSSWISLQAYLVLLWFALLSFTYVVVFYKLRARPSTSKMITTHFIVKLSLLWWFGTEPAMPPRPARIYASM